MAAFNIKKLHMFITRAQRTELAPELLEQMSIIDDLNNYVRLLVERIRRVAQPNKAHRASDPRRLVGRDSSVIERLQLVSAIQDGVQGCMSDNQTIVAYLNKVAEAEAEVEKYHEKYLRQVVAYTLKELRKFSDVTYVQIRQAFDELNKRRTAYDYARERLRKCAEPEIEQRGQEATAHQKSFEQQATILHGLLSRIPECQTEIAKALHYFVKAEAEFTWSTYNALKLIEAPESFHTVALEDVKAASTNYDPDTATVSIASITTSPAASVVSAKSKK